MHSMLTQFQRAIRALNWITSQVCALLTAALSIVVLLQVWYRYVLQVPLPWSEEAARILLVWLAVLAAGVLVAENLNPRVDFIDRMIRGAPAKFVSVAMNLLILIFAIAFIRISYEVAMVYWANKTLVLEISQATARLAFPVAGCLLALNVIARMLSPDAPVHSGIKTL